MANAAIGAAAPQSTGGGGMGRGECGSEAALLRCTAKGSLYKPPRALAPVANVAAPCLGGNADVLADGCQAPDWSCWLSWLGWLAWLASLPRLAWLDWLGCGRLSAETRDVEQGAVLLRLGMAALEATAGSSGVSGGGDPFLLRSAVATLLAGAAAAGLPGGGSCLFGVAAAAFAKEAAYSSDIFNGDVSRLPARRGVDACRLGVGGAAVSGAKCHWPRAKSQVPVVGGASSGSVSGVVLLGCEVAEADCVAFNRSPFWVARSALFVLALQRAPRLDSPCDAPEAPGTAGASITSRLTPAATSVAPCLSLSLSASCFFLFFFASRLLSSRLAGNVASSWKSCTVPVR